MRPICLIIVFQLIFGIGILGLARSRKNIGDLCNSDVDSSFYPGTQPHFYLFCNSDGKLSRWKCPTGHIFLNSTSRCVTKSALFLTSRRIDSVRRSPKSDLSAWNQPLPSVAAFQAFHDNDTLNDVTDEVQFQFVGSCPSGFSAFINPSNGQPQVCITSSPTCQAPYRCLGAFSGSSSGYCCYQASPITLQSQGNNIRFQPIPVCSTGIPYYLNGAPMVCNAETLSCPAGYICQLYSITNVYYCCNGNVPASVCGSGTAYLINSSPVVCSQTTQTCPTSFSCKVHSPTGNSYCCSASTTATGCPTGSTPVVIGTAPQVCQISAPNCPTGSSCQFNSITLQYQCCYLPGGGTNVNNNYGRYTGCPSNQITYVDLATNQPRNCAVGTASTCPSGFGCVTSTTLGRSICCGMNFGCSFNSAGYVNPATGQAQFCQMGQQGTCLGGFQCQVSTQTNQPICCSVATTTTNILCPNGQRPLYAGTTLQQCSGTFLCPNTYQCTQVSSQFVCCPNTNTVPNQQSCLDPLKYGGVCSNSPPARRFYYSRQQQQCIPFIFLGCSGNQNNFETSTQCQQICGSAGACPYGDPLTGRTCSATLACQTGYSCVTSNQGSYCCPSEATICQLPLVPGTQCAGSTVATRYYFNPSTGSCQLFQYLGCGGNANSFQSDVQCQQFCLAGMCRYGSPMRQGNQNQMCSPTAFTCPTGYNCVTPVYGSFNQQICCPRASTVCNEQQTIGSTCTGTNTGVTYIRFYFNPSTKQCQQFTYNGCGGNSNNFVSNTECNTFCSSTICPAGSPYKDPAGNNQICSNGVGCITNYQCLVSGSTSFCCPTPLSVCNQNIAPGQACAGVSVQLQRFYYSSTTRSCQQFMYLGCGGNDNRFDSLTKCNSFCLQATVGQCPNNLQVQMTNNQVQTCTLNVPNSCGVAGYTCMASTTGQAVCCRGNGQCPAGQMAYLRPGTTDAQTCITPGNAAGCPNSYTCTISSNLQGIYVCCQLPNRCPNGLSPEFQTANVPRLCTPNIAGACTAGYTCLSSTVISSQSICCAGTPQCAANLTPFLRPGTTDPQTCTTAGAAGVCPNSFNCMQSANLQGIFICCQQQISCPAGQNAEFSGGVQRTCIQNVITSCSNGYTCVLTANNRYLCCSGTPQCPAGQTAQLVPNTNRPQTCNPAIRTCNIAYTCLNSQLQGVYLCCGNTQPVLQCRTGSPYRVGGSTTPMQCQINVPNNCPAGYICSQTSNGASTICCTGQLACQDGSQAYAYPGSSQPLTCTPGVADRCASSGYTCAQSTSFGTYICCSGSLQCRTGYVPYTGTGGSLQTVQRCTPGTNCPQGYSCLPSAVIPSQYLCCGALTAALCTNNLQAYVNPLTNTKQFCDSNSPNCPSGFNCSPSTLFGRFMCCGAGRSTQSRCSDGSTPYVAPGSLYPDGCNTLAPTCLTGYACRPSQTAGLNYCCSSSGTNNDLTNALCPYGFPYLYPGTNLKVPCNPSADRCPNGHACTQAQNIRGTYLCCGGTQNYANCLNGGTPAFRSGTTQRYTCTAQESFCPAGFVCSDSTVAGQKICCSLISQVKCQNGGRIYLESNQPKYCQPIQPTCPNSYSCSASTTNGMYVCCTSVSAATLSCPQGMTAFRSSANQILECTTNTGVCANGFGCYRSTTDAGRSLCCGIGAIEYCPTGQRPLLTDSNEALECRPNVPNNCAFGYTCTANSKQAKSYCCSSTVRAEDPVELCPSTTSSFLISGVNKPLTCSPIANDCPLNHVCTRNPLLRHTTSYFCCSSINDGCPDGKEAYVNPVLGTVVQCRPSDQTEDQCPGGFTCDFSIPMLRWQCCGNMPRPRFDMTEFEGKSIESIIDSLIGVSDDDPNVHNIGFLTPASGTCGSGFLMVNGQCRQLYWPGEHGCIIAEQCSSRVAGASCSQGYCVCAANQLIYGKTCVNSCQNGYLNVAGRCNPIKALFLSEDAIQDRNGKVNGTIDGWCANTVIPTDQCKVKNSVCDLTKLSCICKKGFRKKNGKCIAEIPLRVT